MKKILPLFIISLFIVALGQPQTSPVISLLASACGFALFWVSLFQMKKRFLYSFLWFFLVQLIQLSWLASPTYQGVYIIFVYIGLSLGLGLEFGILSLFFPKKPPLTIRRSLGIAALWTLMEWSRLHIVCGFAWNPVGLSQAAFPIGSQMAALGGIFALSFWVMFVNLLAVSAFLERRKKAYHTWGVFLLLPYLFGLLHITYHQAKKSHHPESLHVALIQTALLPDQKVYFYNSQDQFVSPYEQWTNVLTFLENLPSTHLDLIVLPEAALPYSAYAPVYEYKYVKVILERAWGDVDLTPLLVDSLTEIREGKTFVSNAFWGQAIADHYGAELVMGLDDFDEEHSYNAAFHFMPQSLHIKRYEKRVLLPGAEYLPFSFLQPIVAHYGIQSFFTHGKEAKVMEGKCPLSISICYEECFSHLIREGRQKGAKLFVNVTNDAWYPFSRLPQQHFDHGRLRAIENGVPLVRACNTGITAGVDSLGRTLAKFENANGKFELEKGALYIPVDLYTFSTLYTIWGDGLILSLSLVCIVFLKPFEYRRRENPLDENIPSD
jgi:apolipoprotein N-acyltransferase